MTTTSVAVRSSTRSAGRAAVPFVPLVLLLVPALLLSSVAAGSGVLPGDVLVTKLMQSLPAELGWLFVTVNEAGTSQNGMLLTLGFTVMLVLGRQLPAALLVLATMPARHLSGRLKALLDSPRPSAELVRITEHASGLGFPSGHVLGATLLYGALFYLAPRVVPQRGMRLAVQTVALVMIVLTGVSRVYVGAHWPSDVLGGYLWGTITLLVLIAGWRWVTARLAEVGVVERRVYEPQGAD